MIARSRDSRAMELYRFVCAVLILCYHCYFFAFQDKGEGGAFVGFYLFVELYFILSGFLMLRSIRRAGPTSDPVGRTVTYMKKRLAALYPHHLLSWCLVAAVLLFVTKELRVRELISIGWPEIALVNVFGFVRDAHINIVCWYLSVLVFSSLIIHYMLTAHEDMYLKIITPVLLVLIYGTIFDRKGSLANTIIFTQYAPFMGFYRGFADITVGAVAYRVYEWMENVKLPGEGLIATAVELAIAAASCLWMYSNCGKMDFLFVPLFAVFVISVFRGRSVFSRLFDNRFSAWLGHVSYAYFLNNLVVIYPFMHFFPETDIWTMCLWCAPACFVLSVLTTALLDGVFKVRKKRV